MPLYEYHCPDCGKDYEEFRSLEKRDDPGQCPHCQGNQPWRKISLFASGIDGFSSGGSSCGGSSGFT